MDFLIGLLAVIFALPLLTGYLAHSYNRSFWLWFVLAMVLPIISWFILVILVWQAEKKMKKEQITVETLNAQSIGINEDPRKYKLSGILMYIVYKLCLRSTWIN